MTRTDWNILMLSLAACVVAVMVFAVVAQAAPVPKPAAVDPMVCVSPRAAALQAHMTPCIETIRIQCPCDLHVRQQDGVITLSGAGTLTVGPKTTDYSGGHWESDAPVSFDNHAPEPKLERER